MAIDEIGVNKQKIESQFKAGFLNKGILV